MTPKLAQALQKLATSPVKLDQIAITRLEKEYGASLTDILTELEDYAIVHQVLNDQITKPKNKSLIAIANGCFWAAAIGISTLLIKPNVTIAAMTLGFTAGISVKLIGEES
ncbi:hypothetical protein H6G64_34070 [Calothrix sp. FACHB-156]|nr:hypothetical protein [Calothrix sp. FACHB-156]